MVRVAVVLMLLAGVVCAEEEAAAQEDPARKAGSWQAMAWGADPLSSRLPEGYQDRKTQTCNEMLVFAGAAATMVDANLSTSLTVSDQEGGDSDASTAWFGMKFVGSSRAAKHAWTITTRIHGSGTAFASSDLEASAWSESLEFIQITGDNKNADGGHLAVEEGGEVDLSIGIPLGVRISFPKTGRQSGTDKYEVSNAVTTSGTGMCCRIRVDSSAEAKGKASSTVQSATTRIKSSLDAEVVMTGSCVIFNLPVEDRFSLTSDPDDKTTSTVTEPSGGFERGAEKTPTDQPTDAEREGEGEDEEQPAVDAGDLWKILTAEERALLEADAKAKE